MNKPLRRLATVVLAIALLALGAAWWTAAWMTPGPTPASGGLYFPLTIEIPVPGFAQADARWGQDPLGPTPATLAAEGCAVTSAAMVLAARGMNVDPGRLNAFLARLPGGYTPEGWLYWEKAAEYDPGFTAGLLPHYEAEPSHFLLDWNLLRGNPVIARLRYSNGVTHFVVVCGKRGLDYLIRDPGRGFSKGLYPLKEFGSPVEAIRFYKREQ